MSDVAHSAATPSSARRSPLDAWFRESSAAAPAREGADLWFEDLSWRCRFGCKGPAAQAWLGNAGYGVPPAPNSAAVDAGGVLVARLATAEFLVEAMDTGDAGFDRVESTRLQLQSAGRPADVYPVARQDLVLGIGGQATNTLLRQICSVDFAPLLGACHRDGGPVILTSMMGVSVVAWPRRSDDGPSVTLWTDPSFAHYFCTMLLEVARDVGSVTISQSSAAGE